MKIFEDSPHIQHMYHYPQEYLTELKIFMERYNLLTKPELLTERIINAKGVPIKGLKVKDLNVNL
jgi:hypothetical protein